VDACTGSGCVAIAILKNRPKLRAIATDLSPAALGIARANAEKHAVLDRLELRGGDLLAPVTEAVAFVVANPPYVTEAELLALAPEVKDHEPRMALVGETVDGLGHHRRLLEQARALVGEGGWCALEIGAGQGDAARAVSVAGWGSVAVEKDLARHDRVMFARATSK
jgi:release factor glutamine methyltransferase